MHTNHRGACALLFTLLLPACAPEAPTAARASASEPLDAFLVTLDESTALGKTSVGGHVTLPWSLPNDTQVTMSVSGGTAATVKPGTVTVFAGDVEAPFEVDTSAVAAPVQVTITATYAGGTAWTKLLVKPSVPLDLELPSMVKNAQKVRATVLVGEAPTTDRDVLLGSDSINAIVPDKVTIKANTYAADFDVWGNAPKKPAVAKITATWLIFPASDTIEVIPAPPPPICCPQGCAKPKICSQDACACVVPFPK